MPTTFLRGFNVNHGTLGDAAPEGVDDLYVTPEEAGSLFGCQLSEQDIRAAMTLINSYCNRPSLLPCEFDSGLIELPYDRQETRLPITPVISITDGAGRFGLGRRDRQGFNAFNTGLVASYMVLLGGVPQWQPIDLRQIELDSGTGIVYIPSTIVFTRFSVVRFRYIAGLLTIPDRIKLAVFEISSNMHAKGISDRTRYSVGRVSRTYASDTFITKQAAVLLEPFRVMSLY